MGVGAYFYHRNSKVDGKRPSKDEDKQDFKYDKSPREEKSVCGERERRAICRNLLVT